jgi:flagellar motor switch protein FliM
MSDSAISQDELDALLVGVSDDAEADGTQEDADASGVRSYDLATQPRIVQGSMPALEMIHERCAQFLTLGMHDFLRRSANVSASKLRLVKYSEFVGALSRQDSINLIQMKPLRGTALMVCDQNLVFLLVDSLFGGNGQLRAPEEKCNFTPTEQRLIGRVLDIVFVHYAKAWESVHPITFGYIRSETNKDFLNIALPNEVVVCTTFAITMGNVTGELHICMPYAMLEPVRAALDGSLPGAAVEQDRHWQRMIKHQVKSAEVEIVAHLATADITFGALLQFQIGDVIPIDMIESMSATIDSVPVFTCGYGKLNGRYALRVDGLMTSQNDDIGEINEL